ncbi:fluoride efflux transporter FluC [Kocuria sp. M1R5S2]|uniref:fluoride efflux transporter FluC n=1 Tax=Kocuria rhizosphaerae TaxID=3376285 RepID=UPI0037977D1F
MSRPPHRRALLVLAVGLGGALGTAARHGLSVAVPAVDGWPVATLAANLLGAFLLGLLLEALVVRGAETSRGTLLRLGAGTGVLGGFTTFSALALETERMLSGGTPGQALAYLGITLAGGFTACLAGVLLAARGRRP